LLQIKLVIVIDANSKGWPLFKMDMKSAIPNNPLEKGSICHATIGSEVKRRRKQNIKLKKTLYGLKLAP